MNNYHISKDGVVRQCRAKTQESCRATSSENKEHFDDKEAAEKAYEKKMEYESLPKPSKKLDSKESIRGFSRSILEKGDKLKSQKPKTPAEMRKLDKDYKDVVKSTDEIISAMRKSGDFTTYEINQMEEINYLYHKVASSVAHLDYFYENRNKIKSPTNLSSKKQKEAIEEHNKNIKKDEFNAIEKYSSSLKDTPESFNKSQAESLLSRAKLENRKYSSINSTI